MSTVRLLTELKQKLDFLAKEKNKSKAEIIKEALESYFHEAENEKDSFELGLKYFGLFGSKAGNFSTDYKRILKEKINTTRSIN
jgi:predicted transcriptional regulator